MSRSAENARQHRGKFYFFESACLAVFAYALYRWLSISGPVSPFASVFVLYFVFIVGLLALAALRRGKMFLETHRLEISTGIFLARLATRVFIAASVRRAKKTKVFAWFRAVFVGRAPEARPRGKFFALDYRLDGQQYSLIVKVPETPWIFTVTDQDGRDQSRVVGPALGPDANFHGALLTPRDFGFETLTILCLGCDPMQKTFTSDEILVIDKKLKSLEADA
jgi:hypothetical protein